MKIKILTSIAGRRMLQAGEVVDLPDEVARRLIARGMAEAVEVPARHPIIETMVAAEAPERTVTRPKRRRNKRHVVEPS